MDLTHGKMCSMVKKWQTMIEAPVEVKTTGGYLLHLSCVGFTKKCDNQIRKTSNTQHQQVCKIRKKMMEILTQEVETNDLKGMVNKLIPDSIGKDIEKSCQSIYRLHDVLVRKGQIQSGGLESWHHHWTVSNISDLHQGSVPSTSEGQATGARSGSWLANWPPALLKEALCLMLHPMKEPDILHSSTPPTLSSLSCCLSCPFLTSAVSGFKLSSKSDNLSSICRHLPHMSKQLLESEMTESKQLFRC
ncbi:40S ribosomal protein S3a [Manis javanica]|nr:40S ribosomal protein S3a [Manis javanica]